MHDMQYLSFKICHPKPAPYQSDDQHDSINAGQFPLFPILIPIHVNHKNRNYRGKYPLLSKEWEQMGMAHIEVLEVILLESHQW